MARILRICAVPKCESKTEKNPFCKPHMQKHINNTLWVDLMVFEAEDELGQMQPAPHLAHAPRAGRPRLEVPSYNAMHKRLRKDRGSATLYDCVDDSWGNNVHKAEDWSLTPGAENYRTWNKAKARWFYYSTNQEDYSPRCKHHHRLLDASHPKGGGTYGMEV